MLDASGDLAVESSGRLFVGESLSYDFLTHEGEIVDGRTQYGSWYLSGSRILLHADGSFEVFDAKLTTCEQAHGSLELAASKLLLLKGGTLSAQNLRVQVFDLPLVWFPALKAKLKSLPRFPVQYKFYWRGPQGPMASMRYRLISWTGGYLGLRLDYLIRKGWGGALEVTHVTPDDSTKILSRNYLATDSSLNCSCPERRFRVEGLLRTKWRDGRTTSYIQWDKLSDADMASDYPESYFDLQVPLRTEWYNTHTRNNFIVNFDGRLRVNNYQTVNQLLPALQVVPLPMRGGFGRGFLHAPIRLAFQDYQYARCIPLPGFHSGRISFVPRMSWPMAAKGLLVTPSAGFRGVYYSDSPCEDPVWATQALANVDARYPLVRRFSLGEHRLEPYIHWDYSSAPGLPFNRQFLFDIQDGYHQLSILRLGTLSTWRPWRSDWISQWRANVYADAFLADSPYFDRIPKAFCELEGGGPRLSVNCLAGWDFVHRLVDTFNLTVGWTCNEDIAIKAELRHRSPWAWRKANWDSYVLDCSVSPDLLVDSPLSDRRTAALMQTFLRFTPTISARAQAYAIWGRPCEPATHGIRLDVFSLLSCNIMLKGTAEFTNLESRFAISLALTNTSQAPRPLNPFKVVR